MWVVLSTRARRWVLTTLALPLLRRVLGHTADLVERRSGPSSASRLLRAAGTVRRKGVARSDRTLPGQHS